MKILKAKISVAEKILILDHWDSLEKGYPDIIAQVFHKIDNIKEKQEDVHSFYKNVKRSCKSDEELLEYKIWLKKIKSHYVKEE